MSNLKNELQAEKNKDNYDSVILSIVIPSYNSVKLLSRCINALENQSAKNAFFEIAIADDGSTDETLEMLVTFKSRSELICFLSGLTLKPETKK